MPHISQLYVSALNWCDANEPYSCPHTLHIAFLVQVAVPPLCDANEPYSCLHISHTAFLAQVAVPPVCGIVTVTLG